MKFSLDGEQVVPFSSGKR